MKVYSPSQTKLFLECEQKWYLQRLQGWESKYLEKKDIAALLGSSYGLGMTHYFKTGRKLSPKEVTVIAQEHFQSELQQLQTTRELLAEDHATEYYGLLPKMVERTMSSDDFIPESWEVTAIEDLIGDSARSRIDLGGKDQNGRPWFWDFKVKTFVKTASVDFTFLKFFDKDWQMLHYAWAYSQMLGQFVDTYYIGMMVVQPTTKFYVKPFTITEDEVVNWLKSATTIWARMEQAEEALKQPGADPVMIAPMSNQHHGTYGKCSHYGLCFGYDTEQFIQIKRGV